MVRVSFIHDGKPVVTVNASSALEGEAEGQREAMTYVSDYNASHRRGDALRVSDLQVTVQACDGSHTA